MPSSEPLSIKCQRPEVEKIAAVEDNFLITPLWLHCRTRSLICGSGRVVTILGIVVGFVRVEYINIVRADLGTMMRRAPSLLLWW